MPLSNYLQDYLEEIKEIELELDGETAKLNFAEAALLLQGSVSVYSKKVEFLWQNVLQMLDLLALVLNPTNKFHIYNASRHPEFPIDEPFAR